MNTTQTIHQYVLRIPKGKPFTIHKLLGTGKRAAMDQAISRLVKAKEITRIARGIFVRPEKNNYLGKITPSPIKIAELIAQNTGSAIQVHGAEAAYRLRLTTQVPTQLIFYTSGTSRRLMLGNLHLTLKHVSPRKLTLAGQPAGLAFTALWYLGKQKISMDIIQLIKNQLPPSEFEALIAAMPAMPGWMADSFVAFQKKETHV